MAILDGLLIVNSILMIGSEIANYKRVNILSRFVIEAASISDRLDAIEKTLIKLIER